jgi:hypothetical protein
MPSRDRAIGDAVVRASKRTRPSLPKEGQRAECERVHSWRDRMGQGGYRRAELEGRRGSSYLGVEVADVGRGILVALSGVLAQQVGAHAGRDARRHG